MAAISVIWLFSDYIRQVSANHVSCVKDFCFMINFTLYDIIQNSF